MDCREFDRRLERFLAGGQDDGLRANLAAHAAGCERCRDLLERSVAASLSADEAEALTGGIMERTSGSPCEFAGELIGDRDAEETDGLLLAAHLEHCGECAALAAALAWADSLLPTMAELDPGSAFTAAVLAATTGDLAAAVQADPIERLRTRWRGMLRRPRFSLEGAYVATLVIVLIFGTPISPAKQAPPRALDALRAGPGALIGALAPHLRWLHGGLSERGQVVWTSGGARLALATSEFGDEFAERHRRAAPAAADLREAAGAFAAALLRIDVREAGVHLAQVGEDIERIWDGYFAGDPAGDEDGSTDTNTKR